MENLKKALCGEMFISVLFCCRNQTQVEFLVSKHVSNAPLVLHRAWLLYFHFLLPLHNSLLSLYIHHFLTVAQKHCSTSNNKVSLGSRGVHSVF